MSYPQEVHRFIHRPMSYHRFTLVVNSVTIVACVVTGLQVCASVGAYGDMSNLWITCA